MNSSDRFYTDERTLAVWIGRLAAPLAVGCLFFGTLVGQSQLAFRDVGHFYTPLYDYVSSRCAHDTLPLWNPLDQTGIPLLGETTTAVLYPIRYLVFSLPLASETALGWYVVIHLLLASMTAWIAARWCGISRTSASLAGTVYPLSGSVLFLYTNPPFLVAAAWMPLVLGACLSRRRLRPQVRFTVISLALAMMVLGGDPQTALHAVMVCTLFLLSQRLWRKNRFALRVMATLVAASIFSGLLALPQIAASISWSRQSYRVLHNEPSSLWALPSAGSQQRDAFAYSFPPWHFAELFSPAVFGDLFPVYRRLSVLIDDDGRIWTPSIYAGLFSLLAFITVIQACRLDRWLMVALLASCLAMGQFGVGWLLSNFTSRLDGLDPAVGGAYWWLYHFFPGYDAFRYPTKWLPFLSIAIAIMAARFLDTTLCPRFAFPIRRLAALAGVALLTVAMSYWIQYQWETPHPLPADRFWGRLELDSAWTQVRQSLVHTLVLTIIIGLAIHFRGSPVRRHRFAAIIIVLTTLDLSLAAKHWIATVDQSNLVTASQKVSKPVTATRWLRSQSNGGFPNQWRNSSEQLRVLEVEASQRGTWFGRWHLLQREAVFNNMTSIRGDAATRFWQAVNEWSRDATVQEQAKMWREIRAWLAIDGIVLTNDQSQSVLLNNSELQLATARFAVDDTPSVQISLHTVWNQVPTSPASTAELLRLLRERFEYSTQAIPTVYADSIDVEVSLASSPQQALSADLIDYENESMTIHVKSVQPTLLTRPILQDGHWNATLLSRDSLIWGPAPVHNVDHLTQGVIVPVGDWYVTFNYRPAWLTSTLVISLFAWMVWLTFVVRGRVASVWFPIRRGR